MKILLKWENAGGCPSPKFQPDIFNKDGVSPLACLMMDDGGQAYMRTIPWLEEGLVKICLIKEGKIDSGDWSRDAWGAQLTLSEVKIYSLYDENYFELVGINTFEKALMFWRDFIQLGPGINAGKRIEIE